MPPAKSCHSEIKIDICLHTIILLFPQFMFEKVQGKHGIQADLQLTPFYNSRFAPAVAAGSTPPDSFPSLHSVPSLYCVQFVLFLGFLWKNRFGDNTKKKGGGLFLCSLSFFLCTLLKKNSKEGRKVTQGLAENQRTGVLQETEHASSSVHFKHPCFILSCTSCTRPYSLEQAIHARGTKKFHVFCCSHQS